MSGEGTVGAFGERELVARLAGFGNLVEVSAPPEFGAELARIGAELVAMYGQPVGSRIRAAGGPTATRPHSVGVDR